MEARGFKPRTVWVGYDAYIRVLRQVRDLFEWALPPARLLEPALDAEVKSRDQLGDLAEEEVSDLAFENDLHPEWVQEQAVELVRAGRREEANRLLALGDFLFPQDAGISAEVVRAMTGEWDAACAALVAIAHDKNGRRYRRLAAMDALEEIGALDAFIRTGFDLTAEYAKASDFESAWTAASAVEVTLRHLLEESQTSWRGEAISDRPLSLFDQAVLKAIVRA